MAGVLPSLGLAPCDGCYRQSSPSTGRVFTYTTSSRRSPRSLTHSVVGLRQPTRAMPLS